MQLNNEDKLKKIEYIKEKISTIDEQIVELVDERFNMGDVLFEYIYKNNIDIIDKNCNEINFSEKTMEYDEYITEFLDYLSDISKKRNNYIQKKYNSKYAYVGDKSNYDLTKFIYEKFLDEKYFRFKPDENLLENILKRKNFVGL
ncbi:chorismate mutase family protein, partial [Helcococcus bovis]